VSRPPTVVGRIRTSAGAWRAHSAAAGRAGWAVADQTLSSLTNFVLVVVVARGVDVEAFGAFTLAFAVYIVCLTLSRSLATDALTIRYSARPSADWARATASATGAAVVFGAAAASVALVAGILVGGIVGPALVVLGLGLVPLLVQEAWRHAFFAAGRGRDAFMNDVVWTVGLVAALAVVGALGGRSVPAYMAAWAAGAAAGAAYGMVQARLVPRPQRALAWWREHSDITWRLAAEGLVLSSTTYVTLLAVTAVAGLAAVGAVRAAQVLMNVLHLAQYGLTMFAVPEAARILQRSPRAVIRFCLFIGTLLAALSLGWGAVLLSMPREVGPALLGETWETARHVIVPMSIVTAAAGFQAGAFVGLRALALAGRSLRARFIASSLHSVGGVVGATVGGAVGTAWGLALGLVLGAALWWRELLRGAEGVSTIAADRSDGRVAS
jgi:O-antigen/teichoic acid export membrane protein